MKFFKIVLLLLLFKFSMHFKFSCKHSLEGVFNIHGKSLLSIIRIKLVYLEFSWNNHSNEILISQFSKIFSVKSSHQTSDFKIVMFDSMRFEKMNNLIDRQLLIFFSFQPSKCFLRIKSLLLSKYLSHNITLSFFIDQLK